MPFTGFRNFARKGGEANRILREDPFNMVKLQVVNSFPDLNYAWNIYTCRFQSEGVAPLSYTSKLLEATETTSMKKVSKVSLSNSFIFLDVDSFSQVTASALFTGKHNTNVAFQVLQYNGSPAGTITVRSMHLESISF